MEKYEWWAVMDGRANYNIGRAIVLESCKTEEEAFERKGSFGSDDVVVVFSNEHPHGMIVYEPTQSPGAVQGHRGNSHNM